MDLKIKKNRLIYILNEYSKKSNNYTCLQEFCWDVIDYYSDVHKTYPPKQEFENKSIFFYF